MGLGRAGCLRGGRARSRGAGRGGRLWFVKSHIEVRSASPTIAVSEFDQVKQRFTGQKPLIELDERGHFLRANTDRPSSNTHPDELHVLAYSPDEDKVVNVTIPFWMLRLKLRGSRINIGGSDLDMEDLHLTVEDLERYGPTLILDHTDERHGEHVLVWSQ
jgi:hypothetical protein